MERQDREVRTGLGALLRRRRLAAELTQEALGERAGLGTRSIQNLERGVHRPHRETLARLVAALDLTAHERAAFEAAARPAPRRRRGGPAAPSDASVLSEGAPAPRHNLPTPLTSFVGREREVAEVRRLLATTRLLTLAGSGGCGKTRLALRAAEVLDDYSDGVWLVEFAPLADPALVPRTVAAALGVRAASGQPILEELLPFVRPRQLLLVLDNCEHLIDACARLVDALLAACPGVRFLATSREPLRVAGEVAWRVPSLAVPPPGATTAAAVGDHAAARLFAERAAAAAPGFALTDATAPAVAEICRRLDGVPLAIELAAARVPALTVGQIAARLDDRFRLLTRGSRVAPPRQQTLRATLDWSHDLLTAPERVLFRRLGVFAGGWTLEAAEAVCADPAPTAPANGGAGFGSDGSGHGRGPIRIRSGDVIDLLAALVDKSLVVPEERDGDVRYRLFETLRQYGWDRSGEAGEATIFACRHAVYYQAFAEEAETHLEGPDQAAWLDRLEREHNNLRAALRWSREGGEVEVGLRLGGALWLFWFARSHVSEGRDWLAQLLSAAGPGRTAAKAKALKAAGMLAHYQGDGAAETRLLTESLAIRRELGDPLASADTLMFQGDLAYRRGDLAQARALSEEGLALNRALRNQQGVAEALAVLSGLAWERGEYALARSLREESLSVHRALGDQAGIAWMLLELGWIVLQQDDLPSAAACFRESLLVSRAVGWGWGTLHILVGFAEIAHHQRKAARAQRLAGAAAAILEGMSLRHGDEGRLKSGRQLDLGRHRGGIETATEAWDEGKAMTPEQAIAYALEEE